MKKLYLLCVIVLIDILSGCAVAPDLQARIKKCSRENNAYSAVDRIGNGGYWSCLDREENNDRYRAQQQQQQAKIEMFRNSCLSFGFQTGTSAFANCMMTQQQQDNVNAQNQAIIELQRQRQAQQQINDGLRMLSPPQNNSFTCYHAPGSPITSCQ
jgi:hypothetical protein